MCDLWLVIHDMRCINTYSWKTMIELRREVVQNIVWQKWFPLVFDHWMLTTAYKHTKIIKEDNVPWSVQQSRSRKNKKKLGWDVIQRTTYVTGRHVPLFLIGTYISMKFIVYINCNYDLVFQQIIMCELTSNR